MADTKLDVMEPLPQPARRPISHKPWKDEAAFAAMVRVASVER
ncbi:hypothetical protein [Aestuariivita sp.]|jgi:hypothetical protein|nr:hypothetical protein [Aestuariivita sp.]